MITDKDIYTHLKNGGSLEDLHKAFANDVNKIQKQIDDEANTQKREKELAEKKSKARAAAFKALKNYFALVNPDVDEYIINSVLDTLETISNVKVDIFDDNAAIPLTRFFM